MTAFQILILLLPMFLSAALLLVLFLGAYVRVRRRERQQLKTLEALERAARR